MRFMLTFYADTDDWLSLPASEQEAAIAEIGSWYGELRTAGRIVEGHRLGHGTKTVRLGSVRGNERPVVNGSPFSRRKEVMGSYCIVEVADEAAALEIAKSWPAGGAVEVRPLAESD